MEEEKIKEPEIIKDKSAKDESGILNKNAKEGSFTPIIFIMLVTLLVASLWEKTPAIKNSVHYILDPSAGFLLNWNLNIGMLIVVFVITFLTTIVQKYGTNQETLKELKKEQKKLNEDLKKLERGSKEHNELSMKVFKLTWPMMKLSMRGVVYTGIPFILFFRWFGDYFLEAGNPKLWLGMSWFLFYLLFAIVFGAILRKSMDVV